MKNNDTKNTSSPTAHREKEPYQYLNPVPFLSLPHRRAPILFITSLIFTVFSTYVVVLTIYCLVLHSDGKKK